MVSELTQNRTEAGIPALKTVLDPFELGRYLRPILPAHWGVLRDVQINALKYHHKSRCVVDITLQTTTEKYGLIGKVYAKDRSDVYRAMKRIGESGFGPEDESSIPQSFAFIPELQLLLQEKLEGPVATEIFLNAGESERTRAAERCARWLAQFHTRAPVSGRVFVFSGELGQHWVRRIAKGEGTETEPLLEKAMLLLKLLERGALGRSEMCGCHGSFSHRQIILGETRTITFDWDKYCVADPAWDVANFIIGLTQLALSEKGSLGALDAAIETFYRTYAGASRYNVAQRLPFYKAAQCLRRAKRHPKHGIENTNLMLDEGLRILAEEI